MSNNSNNVHFLGKRLICSAYLLIIIPHFVQADNDKIQAGNESFNIKNLVISVRIDNKVD